MSGSGDCTSRSIRFVVFSDDWGIHPSSCQHIFKHILAGHEVTWVNTIGMRNPRLSFADIRKVVQKVSTMFSSKRDSGKLRANKNLTVVAPFMLPYMSVPIIRRLNKWLVKRALKSSLPTSSTAPLVVVATVPNAADYVDLLGANRIIYYCVDDFSEWPGLDREFILGMESDLVAKVDVILVTSKGLEKRLRKSAKPVAMLEHGVDIQHFSRPAENEHETLKNIAEPRIGFFGLIDGRLDQSLVKTLSEALPEFQFVFAGPSEIALGMLEQRQNVHFVGRLDYDDLPEYALGMKALMIPYKVDALAEALSPLKLKEYMATGLPVVSSAIPAADEFRSLVKIARTSDEWVDHIRTTGTLSKGEMPDYSAVLEGNSWEDRANRLVAAAVDPEIASTARQLSS